MKVTIVSKSNLSLFPEETLKDEQYRNLIHCRDNNQKWSIYMKNSGLEKICLPKKSSIMLQNDAVIELRNEKVYCW